MLAATKQELKCVTGYMKSQARLCLILYKLHTQNV